LNDSQKVLFKNYVESGHGVVGIHAAIDAFADDNRVSTWPWYTSMIGSVFGTHPFGSNHDGAGDRVISTHSFPGFSALPDRWTW